MLKDRKDLLSALNEHGVEYLVVGGQAVNARGVPRLKKDLNVVDSLAFDKAWERCVVKQVDDNLSAPFLCTDDLNQNKLETGRLQDLADAEQLQKRSRLR